MKPLPAGSPPAKRISFQHLYPLTTGVLLGTLQTGLFFQLTFTLSSGFTTYLLITLCWLTGGALGAFLVARLTVSLRSLQLLMLGAYVICGLLVTINPFNTHLTLIYSLLIGAAGLYPGVFFVRENANFTAREMFLWENNGFILGLATTTLLYMFGGRAVLWALPFALAIAVWKMSGHLGERKILMSGSKF